MKRTWTSTCPAARRQDTEATLPDDAEPIKARNNWPGFSQIIPVGGNVIQVVNPNLCAVRVGVRAGGWGRDFVVPANGWWLVTVPNGNYDIYFKYANEPTVLYQGDSFPLFNGRVQITLTETTNGNYGLRQVQ